MKIKFNWGTGIVIAMVIMIGGMVTLVSIAVRQDYDLVEDDYYQKSVDYQQHIEKVKRTEALEQKITFSQTADSLSLTFPNIAGYSAYSGKIHFYSPVAEKHDLTLPVKLNSVFSQSIDLRKLEAGRYEVKIDWTANRTDYYQETEIVVE